MKLYKHVTPPFYLNGKENQLIADNFDECPPFYVQDMEEENLKEAFLSLSNDEMEAIVSEDHGGIIGFAFKGVAEEMATVLSMNYLISKQLEKEGK